MILLRTFGRTSLGVLLGLGLGLLPASPALAVVAPLGEPFSVDAAPDCQERDPDAASLPGGGFVTVWVASDAGAPGLGRVYARVYDEDRNPVTPEFRVSDNANGQEAPAVAVGSGGRFMVVWSDSGGQIRGRLFEASGAPAGAEIQVGFLFPGAGEMPDVAASPAFGGFAVVWNDGGGLVLRRFEDDGQPIDPAAVVVEAYDPGILGISVRVSAPAITAVSHRDYLVVYGVLHTVIGRQPSSWILAKRIQESLPPQEPPSVTLHARESGEGVIWGVDAGWGGEDLVVAWREEGPKADRHELYARRFFASGTPRSHSVRVDADRLWDRLGDPKVLTDPASGSFLVGWSALINTDNLSPAPAVRSTVWVRLFDHAARPQDAVRQISPAGEVHRENPAFAWAAEREAVAVWQDGLPPPPLAPPQCFSAGITARAVTPGCLPGVNRLCLGEGRFQVEASWDVPSLPGGTGPGSAVPITRDTGYFWFFDLENVELMVKVLDGRALNGNFWVFYGSLSDVAWEMTVTDLVTGAAKTYRNPAGRLASRGDTAALPGADPAGDGDVVVQAFDAVALDREALPAPWWEANLTLPAAAVTAPSHSPRPGTAGPCGGVALPAEPGPGLCLNSERFEVEVAWHDPFNGTQGLGEGVQLTLDSGYFWFFDPANAELVVKVLDGRAVNGKYWVFYGALTNVEYDVRVRHHLTGAEKTYHNPPFQFRSRADTGAFTVTPCNCAPPGGPAPGGLPVSLPPPHHPDSIQEGSR